ncbi:tyrosine-type recombinase/integrase [Aeromonas veronii]|nr:tyrosine-type recombinase/integrase [Aeromonas veronii]
MKNTNYLKEELYELIKTDESTFDFIQESSLDGLWYWDLERPEEEWMNPKFWSVLGYDYREMPHKASAWKDIIYPEDLKLATENFIKHCENPDHLYDQINILTRTSVVQQKTGTPVMFEIIAYTRESLRKWIAYAKLNATDYLFPSRKHAVPHLGTRAYDRLVHKWVSSIGLDSSLYGTHSMRRTKVSILYKRDKNLRAIQLLLGHKKIESTVRYLGIDVQDALASSETLEL